MKRGHAEIGAVSAERALTPLVLVAVVAVIVVLRLAPSAVTSGDAPTRESRSMGAEMTPDAVRARHAGSGEGVAREETRTGSGVAIWPPIPSGVAATLASGAVSEGARQSSGAQGASPDAGNGAAGIATKVTVPDARAFVAGLYRTFFGVAGDPRAIELWASLIDAGSITPEQAVETFLDSAHQYRGTAPVARLYLATFLRAPDFDGLAHWRDAILGGATLDDIGARFAASPEFANRYGALDDAAFIDQAFQNALGREPTEAERMLWRSRLGPETEARGRMMVALSESEEFRVSVRGEVDAILLYAGLLGRAADTPGFAGWMEFLHEGNTRQALIRGFLSSSEFRARLHAAGTGNGG